MARPVSVTIPHNLGKAEARKRIETGFGQIRQNLLGGVAGMMTAMFIIFGLSLFTDLALTNGMMVRLGGVAAGAVVFAITYLVINE